MKNNLEIYTDGSSLGNPGKGGWGYVLVDKNIIKKRGGYNKETTNNQMEITAVIEAMKDVLKTRKKGEQVTINTDSNYVLSGATIWIINWEKNGWKTAKKEPVLNKELWIELITLLRNYKGEIIWQKVKGHSGHVYNDMADEIATSCALQQKSL